MIRCFLATCLACMAFPAGAVYLAAEGVGQALLFPYYTARQAQGDAFNTYVSVTNNSLAEAVVVKVRFREGRNSRLVAEFNLYLAAQDMWTAAVVPAGEGARLITRDRSCTNPSIAQGLAFSSASFAGGDDHAGTGLERVREGHFEFIEMGSLPDALAAGTNPSEPGFTCEPFEGIPNLTPLGPPPGALSGNATLINVASGLDAAYVADALAALTSTPFYSRPGQPGSDFDSPEVDAVSQVNVGGKSYRLTWARGLDAVNSAIMATALENEFVLDAGTGSRTDWVIAFPTRRLSVTNTTAEIPFQFPFATTPFPPLACEGLTVAGSDREASGYGGIEFPEPPPSAQRVCWSVNAFSVRREAPAPVGSSDVLGAVNTLGWPASLFPPVAGLPGGFSAQGAENGRFRVSPQYYGFVASGTDSTELDLAKGTIATGARRQPGLPAIGFVVRTFSNGTLACSAGSCQGNYASAFPHRRIREIYSVP